MAGILLFPHRTGRVSVLMRHLSIDAVLAFVASFSSLVFDWCPRCGRRA
jgi:hypothetical protein